MPTINSDSDESRAASRARSRSRSRSRERKRSGSRETKRSGSRSESESEPEEEEYEVEKVLDRRERRGVIEYFVKWIGWDHADNTWEPEQHLEGTAEDKINDYERLAKEKEQRRKEHKRKEREKDRERERQREKEKAKKIADRQRRREEEERGGGEERKSDKDRDRKHDEKDRKRREEREKEKAKKKRDEAGLFKVEQVKKKEKEIKEPVIKHGFARGLKIEKILGVTKDPGELMFFVQWKGGEKPELVMAKEAYAKAPQIILKWYESQLVWNESEQKKENAETVKLDVTEAVVKEQSDKEKINSESVKPETEKVDKPDVAKTDNDNSDVSKKQEKHPAILALEKEKEGTKEKEEKSKDEEKVLDSSNEKKDPNDVPTKQQVSAKSVPDPLPVHKYF